MPLYIGSFSFQKQKLTNRQEGEFQILITANSFEEALEEFRKKIEHTRASSTLLSGKIRIILDRILELPIPPSEAVMLNFQYQDAVTERPLIVQPIADSSESVVLYRYQPKSSPTDKPTDWSDSEFLTYPD